MKNLNTFGVNFYPRQKTGVPANLPLLPKALEIIEKYKNHLKCKARGKILPMISNRNIIIVVN